MRMSNHLLLHHLSILVILLVPSLGLNVDGTLLLSFKYSILSDPLSVLENWDYNDATPCSWTGVTCSMLQTQAQAQTPIATTPDDHSMLRVVTLNLTSSQLVGIIPQDLGFIPHLTTLDLSTNFLNGTLPDSLFNASALRVLSLSGNSISGVIPEFVRTSGLEDLNLSENGLSGNVPKSITSLQNLTVVSLRGNRLSGHIPSGISNSIQVLDLSSNLFDGSLPDVGFGRASLKYLNLSSNKLTGIVPPHFASRIPANATIDLSFNNLSGKIPEESVSLSNQKSDAYAGNQDLCGKVVNKLCPVPSTLSNPPNDAANTSSPAAIAVIPKTITASPNSPGSAAATSGAAQIAPQHGLQPGAIAGIAVIPLASVGVLAAVALYIYQKRKKSNDGAAKQSTSNACEYKKDPEKAKSVVVNEARNRNLTAWPCLNVANGEDSSEATASDSDEKSSYGTDQREKVGNERSLVMVDKDTELELETLFKASAYVLGTSGAGIVYKAVLQDGTALAVRRIGETGVRSMKEFESQVKAIAKLRHPNMVHVRGFYWGDDEKLVICDYVSNGSLANVGYRKVSSSPYHLPFETRLKIARGVARGLSYIHEKKNVHGNIKPSNILLTPDMDPIISDFGLHWLIHGRHAHKSDGSMTRHFGSYRSTPHHHEELHDQQVAVNGSPYIAPTGFIGCTSPYHAPESLKKLKPNPKWDVYSFGVLLLEILTGKVFSERELIQWDASTVDEDPSCVVRTADVAIRADAVGREEALVAWFKLGLRCASLAPQKRPSMKDALAVLENLA